MHELSIAYSLIDLLLETIADEGEVRVRSVRLRIGPLSGIEPAALRSAFAIAIQRTPLDGAALNIEEVPVRVFCPTCDSEQAVQSVQRMRCAVCDTPAGRILSGREMEIVSLEVDDVPAPNR